MYTRARAEAGPISSFPRTFDSKKKEKKPEKGRIPPGKVPWYVHLGSYFN
jgi:hypothetical protein